MCHANNVQTQRIEFFTVFGSTCFANGRMKYCFVATFEYMDSILNFDKFAISSIFPIKNYMFLSSQDKTYLYSIELKKNFIDRNSCFSLHFKAMVINAFMMLFKLFEF